MDVDLSGGYVPMPKKLLHGANVVAVLQQARGEGVAKGVGAGAFGDPGMPYRVADRPLENRLVEVVSAVLARHPIDVVADPWIKAAYLGGEAGPTPPG